MWLPAGGWKEGDQSHLAFLLLQNLALFNFTNEVHVFIYSSKKMLSDFSTFKSIIQMILQQKTKN